jgi:hypothetical protein
MLKHDRWLLSPDHFTADGYMTVSCYVISDAARAAANKPTLSRDLRIFGDACESSYDVSLNCHDGQVLAFKTVLAARCPEFFGVMLYELTAADNNRVVVTVPAIVNAPTVQLFVDYTVSDDSISYAGLTTPQLTQLFLLADMWNFGTLKDACQYVLMSRMDAATCCTLLVTSETHHCAALKDLRYGLAFILEHGFMRTEKGRTCYKANLEQIRNAVLESMHIGVIEALLKAKQFSHAWTKKYGQASRSGSALRGVLGEEIEMYATIQKNEHGFDLVRSPKINSPANLRWALWDVQTANRSHKTSITLRPLPLFLTARLAVQEVHARQRRAAGHLGAARGRASVPERGSSREQPVHAARARRPGHV